MNRLLIIVIGSIILLFILGGSYIYWKRGVEKQALYEYNQKQFIQNIKDQEILRKKLEEIAAKQKEIEDKTNADNKTFNDKINSITTMLDSKQAIEQDRPSSKILKDTIKRLKETTK